MAQTAYARMQARLRREESDKNRLKQKGKAVVYNTPAKAKKAGYCGGKKRNGDLCYHKAGWGTTHPGIGCCKMHGGAAPSSNAAAARNEAIMMGAPVDINPVDALIWCIKLTAGEVEFCNQQLAILEEDEWLESTMVGKQIHVWAKERQKSVDRLAKYAKDAIGLGLAERAIKLAEQYGASIARYTKGLLDDLELTPEQIKVAPLVVRKHLALLEGGRVTDEDRREPLAALPRRTVTDGR